MNSIMNFFEKFLIPPLTKIGEERHLIGIRNGMIVTVPFTIAGSIFLIISALPIPGWSDIIKGYSAQLSVPVNVTFGIISLIAAIGIGYSLSRAYEHDPIAGAAMSLVGFLTLQITPKYELNTVFFGSKGLFTAIVIAIFAVEVQKYFIKHKLVIKLPANVPPAIAKSFEALIPAMFMITFLWVIRVVLNFDLTAFITMLFKPFVFALNTLPGVLVYMFISQLLWTVGIHGQSIMNSVGTPIFLQFLTENVNAFMSGKPPIYITATGFIPQFVSLGGAGATLALVLLMLKSKNGGFKALGRASLASGIFNINEPILFGLPIVLNPIMIIPFVIVDLILITLTYSLMYFNIIGKPIASLPWTMPPIIGGYLVTGGDWKAAVWNLVEILIAMACYYPFFKAAEAQRECEKISSNQSLNA
ncbi:PTS sugar transporter subunit IIC [Fonticella tunisiensis]|uniref:Permease IIC component n=1 Tax=Fonticella tunisiensis TaxID=1096341 RepID=A0A4R7K5A1_9CLOT|nr:PTS transporter subunit EIIC [Fonticella tunisiensis]TDT46031.1 PTS system cellobiose-specific IIC component [Fonticella tunisiensis]